MAEPDSMTIQGEPVDGCLKEIVAKCSACGQEFVAVLHNPPRPCFKCRGKVELVGRFASTPLPRNTVTRGQKDEHS